MNPTICNNCPEQDVELVYHVAGYKFTENEARAYAQMEPEEWCCITVKKTGDIVERRVVLKDLFNVKKKKFDFMKRGK